MNVRWLAELDGNGGDDGRRVYNAYLDAQLQTTTSLNGDAQAYLDQIGTV